MLVLEPVKLNGMFVSICTLFIPRFSKSLFLVSPPVISWIEIYRQKSPQNQSYKTQFDYAKTVMSTK